MYTYPFELLETIGLSKKGRVSRGLRDVPQDKLFDQLRYYRESMIRVVNSAPHREVKGLAALRSSNTTRQEIQNILPSAIVYESVFIDDPIARLYSPRGDNQATLNAILPMKHGGEVNVDGLHDAIDKVLRLKPLIESNCVTLLPIDSLHDAPSQIPIFFSEDWFTSCLPRKVYELGQTRRQIYAGEPIDGGGMILRASHTDVPSRLISVHFQGDFEDHPGPCYIYTPIEFEQLEDDGLAVLYGRPDFASPPSQEEYDAWTLQSVNRSLIQRLGAVSREAALAHRCGAKYCTESLFEAELLSAHSNADVKDMRMNEVNFISANEEELRLDDPQLVAKVRSKYGHQLRQLRAELVGVCDEIKASDDFVGKAKQVFHRQIQPQIREVDCAVMRLCGEVAGQMTLAGFAATMMTATPEITPITLALYAASNTVAGARQQIVDFIQARKGPAFLWHQLARRS